MSRIYNAPAEGSASSIGSQIRTDYYIKQALIDLVKEQYFTQMADTKVMPKHYGKKLKRYHYLPMLDDANLNDQGIDAAGATITQGLWYIWMGGAISGDVTDKAGYATRAEAQDALDVHLLAEPEVYASAAVAQGGGNLYGSSKDVGVIASKLPALSETGGRVNRVGFKRVEIEGTFEKFGFFDEYTEESLNFDTDEELEEHINREMLRGANEITEDALQIDLLNAANTIQYTGDATSMATISGESDPVGIVTYDDLVRLSIKLDNNRTPKNTKVITGSRMVDTKVIPAARYLYCGSEMLPTLEKMVDYHNERAWIPVEHYAAATSIATGEAGKCGPFRVIIVPEMMHWAGAGAISAGTTIYRDSVAEGDGAAGFNDRYDVFPLLTVGSESFTTIGFQTGGGSTKFRIFHKKPGREMADLTNPYGELGFMSIKWYYGFMELRPERIGLIYSVAEM